ncbi:MAG TPA: ABC transporter ATP-binding protein, partial [Blastocatellia bacterium]|nr:ABC transporter ATP-binding protein [Blastocatellia bacterium]
MNEPVVSLRNITKKFGPLAAVDSVTLDVAPGEFVTLLGPSGCGKTTLLRVIAGFESPDIGEVWIGTENVTNVPPHRRDVHTVFQQYALFPHLTVAGNVAFGLERKRVARDEITRRVAEALELVQLTGFDTRLPAQLSGGQQQRVA